MDCIYWRPRLPCNPRNLHTPLTSSNVTICIENKKSRQYAINVKSVCNIDAGKALNKIETVIGDHDKK